MHAEMSASSLLPLRHAPNPADTQLQHAVHAALRSSDIGTQNLLLEPWSVADLFDEQVRDDGNFHLSENQVGAITAVLTGLSILLITDALFRTIVRASDTHATSFAVYRRALLLRAASPIEWVAPLLPPNFSSSSETPRQKECHPLERHESTESARPFPPWQRVAIPAVGLLLIAAELLLIFLATNRQTVANLDLTRIPSIALQDRGRQSVQLTQYIPCSAQPLTSRSGFSALGSLQVCAYISLVSSNKEVQLNGTAIVKFTVVAQSLVVTVGTHELVMNFNMRTVLTTANGTDYMPLPAVRAPQLEPVMRPTFARWNMSISAVVVNDTTTDPELPNWTAIFSVDLRNATFPESELGIFRQAAALGGNAKTEAELESLVWNNFVHGIAHGPLVLTGRSRAYLGGLGRKTTLDEQEETLIVRRRPWLGILGSAVLTALCAGGWAVVAGLLRWQSGVDECVMWLQVFETISSMQDFYSKPDEHITI